MVRAPYIFYTFDFHHISADTSTCRLHFGIHFKNVQTRRDGIKNVPSAYFFFAKSNYSYLLYAKAFRRYYYDKSISTTGVWNICYVNHKLFPLKIRTVLCVKSGFKCRRFSNLSIQVRSYTARKRKIFNFENMMSAVFADFFIENSEFHFHPYYLTFDTE